MVEARDARLGRGGLGPDGDRDRARAPERVLLGAALRRHPGGLPPGPDPPRDRARASIAAAGGPDAPLRGRRRARVAGRPPHSRRARGAHRRRPVLDLARLPRLALDARVRLLRQRARPLAREPARRDAPVRASAHPRPRAARPHPRARLVGDPAVRVRGRARRALARGPSPAAPARPPDRADGRDRRRAAVARVERPEPLGIVPGPTRRQLVHEPRHGVLREHLPDPARAAHPLVARVDPRRALGRAS